MGKLSKQGLQTGYQLVDKNKLTDYITYSKCNETIILLGKLLFILIILIK